MLLAVPSLFLLVAQLGLVSAAEPTEIYNGGELLAPIEGFAPAKGLSDGDLGLSPPRAGLPALHAEGGAKKRDAPKLTPRQSTCKAGYGLCPDRASCCPLGGACCTSRGTCCGTGYHCCTGGDCCPNTHNCVVVGGQRGCCPIGKTCTSIGASPCKDPGYIPCSSYPFCCLPGHTCALDSLGNPICIPPGATTTATYIAPPTTTTTYIAPAPTTTTTYIAPAPTTTINTFIAPPTSPDALPTSSSSTYSSLGPGVPSTQIGPLFTFSSGQASGTIGAFGTQGPTSGSEKVTAKVLSVLSGAIAVVLLTHALGPL